MKAAMIRILGVLTFLSLAQVAQAADAPAKYAASCGACHAYGVANAPKTGDAGQWEPRLAKGMDALVASVKKGLNAMPPGGLCNGCSDEEYKELITYMATPQ